MNVTADHATWLRTSLRGNALFSGLSGMLFLVAAQPIAMFLGIGQTWMLRAIGPGLILYAFWLVMIARRPTPDRREVWAAIGLDTAWVIGSAVWLIAGPIPLTLAGKWTVGIVADIVATFALLQFYGLCRPCLRATRAFTQK